MSKPFGRSLHYDAYGVCKDLCRDIDAFYNLLDRLPAYLGMEKMAPPYIFKLGEDSKWPDKAGLTGFVPLVESGITVHTLSLTGFVSVDLYTCGSMDPGEVKRWLDRALDCSFSSFHYLTRGEAYSLAVAEGRGEHEVRAT